MSKSNRRFIWIDSDGQHDFYTVQKNYAVLEHDKVKKGWAFLKETGNGYVYGRWNPSKKDYEKLPLGYDDVEHILIMLRLLGHKLPGKTYELKETEDVDEGTSEEKEK